MILNIYQQKVLVLITSPTSAIRPSADIQHSPCPPPVLAKPPFPDLLNRDFSPSVRPPRSIVTPTVLPAIIRGDHVAAFGTVCRSVIVRFLLDEAMSTTVHVI